MIKRIYVYAYFNYNLGDDLFIRILCNRYPTTKIYCLVSDPKYKNVFKEYSNITFFSNNTWFVKIYKKIARMIKNRDKNKDNLGRVISFFCNASLVIGGSLFMEPVDNWEAHSVASEYRILKRIPSFIIGSNFGPFTNLEFYKRYKHVFKKYTDICFRDTYSYKLFKNLDNVRFAPDVVFSLNYINKSIQKRVISISVIDLKSRIDLKKNQEKYKRLIIKIMSVYINLGYEVQLISFCKNEGDEEMIEEIINMVPSNIKQYINSLYYNGDIDFILEKLGESEYIIATRFHCMVLGWILNIPVLPIVYSNKMLNVINDIQFSGKYIAIEEINAIDNETIMHNHKNNIIVDVGDLKNKSLSQFEALDNYITKY